eukprot:3812002-Amphidinium_carterae.1
MCRVCVEANWDNVITAIGYGGLIAQPGAPGHAMNALNRLRTVRASCVTLTLESLEGQSN